MESVKNWREYFSLARNLINISSNQGVFFNNFSLQETVILATHKRRQFLKKISIRRKICSPSSNKNFYYN